MITTFNPDDKLRITVFSHQELIQYLYKDLDDNISYTLKQEIFNFKKKTNFKESLLKRKVKAEKIAVDTDILIKINNYESQFKLEVEELQNSIQNWLLTSTNQQIFQQPIKEFNNEFDLNSIINEPVTFPQFKGSNTTGNSIKIQINKQEYIIPPFSKFYNYNIKDINEILLNNDKFDLIILDPPWRNKYIRRLKKSKCKSSAAYEMLNNDCIKNIPIPKFLTLNSLVVLWCTNSYQHQNAILNSFLPTWNLRLITKFYWIKMDVNGSTICNFSTEFGKKQPFEIIFIACPENCTYNFEELTKDYKKNILMSVPSLINSHKPPLMEILRDYLPSTQPKCLEIFARYLQPNFTSIGLEVLKLMDARLYNKTSNSTQSVL